MLFRSLLPPHTIPLGRPSALAPSIQYPASNLDWGIHTEETRIERDTCTPVFITALFIIARIWKQYRCPSADEWIRKLWYIYTMEYYSAIKKNTFKSVLMRWMKLEPIIQSEVSQKEKHQYSMLLLSRFSRVRLCATPETAAHQAPPSLGFSRQEHWSSCHFLLQCMKVKSESESEVESDS